MLKKPLTRLAVLIGVSVSVLLVAIFWNPETQPPSRPKDESIPVPSPAVRGTRYSKVAPRLGDNGNSDAFKRTIIDNNLFRPLGWTPPRPKEPYRLLGTILPRSANTPPKAILQSTAGHPQTYIVTIGDNLDASTEVVSIEPKQVKLSTNGQTRTLHLKQLF